MNSDEIFIRRVLAWSDQWLNIQYFTDNKLAPSRAYKTPEEMLKGLVWIKRQTYVRDIYVCMSSQSMAEPKSTANGFVYNKGIRSTAGAVELKSLFIDIDVKPGAYADTAAVARALKDFMKASGMPRPTLFVETGGGGIHAHWVLDRALKVADWLVLALALKAACKQHGLITDEGVTADAARILRMPGTINHKYAHKPVATMSTPLPTDYPVAMIEQILAPYTKPASTRSPPPGGGASVHHIPLNADLGGGSAPGPLDFDEYEDAAKFLRDKGVFDRTKYEAIRDFCFATAWAAITYPDMADKLEKLFKDISASVPDRDPAKADGRWDKAMIRIPERMLRGDPLIKPASIFKMALDLGWTKPAPKPPPGATVLDLPVGYYRSVDGTIWGRQEDKKTGLSFEIQVSRYPMDQAWLSDEPALNFVTVISKKPRVIHLLTEKASRKETMTAALAQQGFMIPPSKTGDVQEFIVAWITQLQTANKLSHAPAFGWVPGGGFAFNGKVYTAGKPGNAGRADDVTSRHYAPTGDPKPWADASGRIISEQRHDLNAIIASAFAAPLVKFTGQDGLLMSACSQESGIGKTVALRIAAAVWGHPVHSAQTLDDTQNSVVKKLGEIRHLPVYWDEIKSESQAEKFVNIAFMLSGGREKSRLTQSATSRTFGSWETMLVACSNDSIAESVAAAQKSSTASALRLFEFRVAPPATAPADVAKVGSMVAALKANHGHAGDVYAEYLGANQAKVEAMVMDVYEKLAAKYAAPAEERFWVAVVASVFVGAHIANDLGLTAFDEKGLLTFMCAQWVSMRTAATTSESDLRDNGNLSSVLGRFLRDMRAYHTLYTDRIWAGRGRPKNGDVTVVQSPNNLRDVKVQIGKTDKRLRIAAVDLGDWMRKQKLSQQAFNLHFVKQFNMTKTTACLASGTDYVTAQMKCYDFDLSDPAMMSFFDGIDLS